MGIVVFKNDVKLLSDYGKSDSERKTDSTDNKLLIETIVTARAAGKIKWTRN